MEVTERPAPGTPTWSAAAPDAVPGDAAPVPHPWRKDILGLTVTALVSVAIVIPALSHGTSLGEYDWLGGFSLTHQARLSVHNPFASDQITQMIPWSSLAWTQVHHGHLPLWNPYNVLGMPLAFNWQSAAFSVPSLIGYVMPLRLAYTTQVMVTLVVAGTGTYVCARVLRMGAMAATLAGVTFALSGPFLFWVGWPIGSVMSWLGWFLAAIVLVARGERRLAAIGLLACIVAASIYAGQPDALVLVVLGVAVFTVAYLGALARHHQIARLPKVALDLALAGGAGIGLGLPLLFPGAQLLEQSVRAQGGGALNAQSALSVGDLFHAAFLGLADKPTIYNYDYLGLIGLVLALVAILFRIRRPDVLALVAMLVVAALLCSVNVVISGANAIPGLGAVRFPRTIVICAFCISLLAGVGLDALRRAERGRREAFTAALLFAAVGVVVVVLSAVNLARDAHVRLPSLRADIVWSVVSVVVGGVASLAFLLANSRHRDEPGHRGSRLTPTSVRTAACALLLLGSAIFLFDQGRNLWSTSAGVSMRTPAELQLEHVVGSSVVGLGTDNCVLQSGPGIPVNANILFGVRQFAVYDPLTPADYFQGWTMATGQPAGTSEFSHFCPAITSVAEARWFGIGYVLEPAGKPGPAGTRLVATVAGQGLYRVPGTADAVLVPLTARRAVGSGQQAVRINGRGTTHLTLRTDTPTRKALIVHVGAAPGWHATIDGRPLALHQVDHIMLGATVPPGRHTIRISYWPTTFTLGIAAAILVMLVLIGTTVVTSVRRSSQRRRAPVQIR